MSNPNPGTPSGSPAPQRSAGQLEMASVLFMDIVSYSLEPMERQSSLLGDLQQIVRDTAEFQRAQQCQQIISLPTGDGMALVFFDTPLVAVECALQVGRSLKEHPDLKLRMGVHTGPVYRINDINAQMNVAGGGINLAQRVMDAGDAGHLIVSSAVAEVLRHLSGWPQYLKDLGDHAVKHGVKLHLYAICTDDVANHDVPRKLAEKAAAAQAPVAAVPAAVVQASAPRGLYMAAGSVATILVLALALTKGPALFDSGRAASLPGPGRVPVTFQKEATPESKSSPPAASSQAPRELRSTTPLPSAQQIRAEQDRSVLPARNTPAEPQTAAQVTPAVVVPAPVPQVTQAAPPTPQIDPAVQQELRNASELLTNLRSRASAVQSGLAGMKQQQAGMGMNLRGDIVAAEQRMQSFLGEAQNALRAGDSEKVKSSLKNAERALETIETFLGR